MYRRCLIGTTEILGSFIKDYSPLQKINVNDRCLAYDGRFRRLTTSTENQLEKVTFSKFQSLINDKEVVIIDVREPQELIEHGTLPRSINVPLGELESALKYMSNDEFTSKYGHNKPHEEATIIFSCQMGMRSEKAQLIALQLGYKNVKNYIGGWAEWAKKVKK